MYIVVLSRENTVTVPKGMRVILYVIVLLIHICISNTFYRAVVDLTSDRFQSKVWGRRAKCFD